MNFSEEEQQLVLKQPVTDLETNEHLVGAITLAAYWLGEYVLSDPTVADGTANTMAFATLRSLGNCSCVCCPQRNTFYFQHLVSSPTVR